MTFRLHFVKRTIALSIATVLLLALSSPTVLKIDNSSANHAHAAADVTRPSVTITTPDEGASMQTGVVSISGIANDNSGGSGVQTVQVKLGYGGTYKTATPKAAGDWSTWSSTLSIATAGSHKIISKATDNSGNYAWYTVDIVATSPPGYLVTISMSSNTITAKDSAGKVLASGTDASTVIQAGVNAIKAKSSGGTLHINAGTYLIKTRISLSGTNNIVLEGDARSTTILKSSVAGAGILYKGSTSTRNVTIQDMTIDGANISGRIVSFSNIDNLLIDNVILERHNQATGPGVYISGLDGAIIQNSIIRNPSAQGDALGIGGVQVTFQNNEITRQNARGGGFTSGGLVDSKILNNNFHDFKGYAATSMENYSDFKNVEIAYNTYRNLDANAISSLGYANSATRGTFDNINIHHNHIENAVGGIRLNAMDGVTNAVTYNSRISDNTLLYTAGIAAGPLKSCEIDNNTIDHTDNWRGYGVYLYKGSDDVTMDGNKISNTARPAYYYTGSTDVYVNGAKVT